MKSQTPQTSETGQVFGLPRAILAAADLCRKSSSVDVATRNEEVYALFEADAALLNIPVTENGKIAGLINRDSFMRGMAGRYYWELFSKRSCRQLMHGSPFVVEADTPIRDLANGLLDPNGPHRFSEGFIVAANGTLIGTGLTSDVLAAILVLERQASEALRQNRDMLSALVEERTRDLQLLRQAEEAQKAESLLAMNIIDRLTLRDGLRDERLQYWCQPADHFSGDTIAAARSNDGILYAMLADATGHGLTAAITVVPILTLFYRLVAQRYPLEHLAYELNRELMATMPSGRFVAASLVALDQTAGVAKIWQGGMPDILHLDHSGQRKDLYASTELPLGIIELDEGIAAIRTVPVAPGDQLVLFSDGLLEAENAAGEAFGIARITAALLHPVANDQIQRLQDAVEAHIGDTLPHDDVTLLVISSSTDTPITEQI